jgi:nucleotide-binding universal stress UspA family protein
MARKSQRTVARAIADALSRRDRFEMEVADKLLSVVERRRKPGGAARREARSQPMTVSTQSRSWRGFRSILCPIDFSEHSRRALRYAEAVAARANARLTVTYANDPLLVAAAAAALHDRRIAQRSGAELRAFVEGTLAGRGLPWKSQVSVGNPAQAILKAAASTRADLIVLGTHGLTGANRLLIGSTTLSVLQRTTVPVLAVPASGDEDELPHSWPGERIALALELSGSGSRAEVDGAARVAEWFGSSLILLHVVDEITAPDWFRGDLSAHERILVERAQQQIDQLAARARRIVPAEGRVVCGRIADEVAALMATERINLLITELRERRGWFGARRGSVSYHVLTHAVSPVLACPPQWLR